MNAIQDQHTGGAAALAPSAGDLGGKYLGFRLGDETYGLQILSIQEIIGIMDITKIPQTPDYVRGVVNLRGCVLPVIELRAKFGLDCVEDTEHTCIVVVQVATDTGQVTMGIIVDNVSEVIEIASDQIEPPPDFGENHANDMILGIGKVGNEIIMLLKVESILSIQNLAMIDELSRS
ncbi:MAG: purine-binding chemotaxis protein CheW [bacterium]|nr:purine-binding chemotaxis protein CheW [bacterium]